MAVEQIEIGDPDPGNPGGGGGGGGGGGTIAVFQFPFTKHEGDSLLKVLVYAGLSSPDDLQLTGFVSVDGVVRQATPINLVLDNQNSKAQAPMTMPFFIEGLAAGDHEIVFSVTNSEPDGPLTVRRGAYIEIVEIKRAAR